MNDKIEPRADDEEMKLHAAIQSAKKSISSLNKKQIQYYMRVLNNSINQRMIQLGEVR